MNRDATDAIALLAAWLTLVTAAAWHRVGGVDLAMLTMASAIVLVACVVAIAGRR